MDTLLSWNREVFEVNMQINIRIPLKTMKNVSITINLKYVIKKKVFYIGIFDT